MWHRKVELPRIMLRLISCLSSIILKFHHVNRDIVSYKKLSCCILAFPQKAIKRFINEQWHIKIFLLISNACLLVLDFKNIWCFLQINLFLDLVYYCIYMKNKYIKIAVFDFFFITAFEYGIFLLIIYSYVYIQHYG